MADHNADVWPDDRLRLVFTCCHPALAVEAQVGLTLRLICGLTTAEVARGLLVGEATMAARITRALYDLLTTRWPSPVVALNRAVAVGFAQGPAAGLVALNDLAAEPQLAQYPYLAAARANFHRQLGHHGGARLAYEEALILTDNQAERDYLTTRINA